MTVRDRRLTHSDRVMLWWNYRGGWRRHVDGQWWWHLHEAKAWIARFGHPARGIHPSGARHMSECAHGYFDTEDCPQCPPKPTWGVFDLWKDRLVGRMPFRSKSDAESYAEFGNTAEGEKRYEARAINP